MAESGYTKYPHWLEKELIQSDLTGREFKIIIAILRCTFGYNSDKAIIAYNRLADMTGIRREHCIKVVSALKSKGWISVKRSNSGVNIITFTKGEPSATDGTSASAKNGAYLVPQTAPIKEKAKKGTVTDLPSSEVNPNGKKISFEDLNEEDFDD